MSYMLASEAQPDLDVVRDELDYIQEKLSILQAMKLPTPEGNFNPQLEAFRNTKLSKCLYGLITASRALAQRPDQVELRQQLQLAIDRCCVLLGVQVPRL